MGPPPLRSLKGLSLEPLPVPETDPAIKGSRTPASFTFAIGIVLGVGAMTKGPALVASYLPKSISGQSERIDGEVVRKQRDGNRLLVKVATTQGPMLVTFTQKVAELDLLLEPGDRMELIASGYATFVEDPTLERVKRPAGTGGTPSPPSTSSGSPQGSQEKTGR